jgi:hypothetical protein
MPIVKGDDPGVIVSLDLDAELLEDDAAVRLGGIPFRLLDLANHAGVHQTLLTENWGRAATTNPGPTFNSRLKKSKHQTRARV